MFFNNAFTLLCNKIKRLKKKTLKQYTKLGKYSMVNSLSQESINMDSKKGRTQEIFGKEVRHVMEIE